MLDPVLLPLELPELDADLGGGRMRRTVHPSGLRVLTEEVPGARSATIGFWVGVGSRDEQAEQSDAPASLGSTHFLEHLLFKGTPQRSAMEIATGFDRIGAENNALTAKEYTCYYAKVRDVDVEDTVRVLSDMVTNSLLDAEEFENERGVILEELAMAADDLADVANERFFAAVFDPHPLGRPIGGSPETIRAARRDDVMAHYRARYDPSTLVVAVAGAVDHDRVVDAVLTALDASHESRWSTAKGRTAQRRRQETPDAEDPVDGLLDEVGSGSPHLTERESEQLNILIGSRGLSQSDPRRFALGLMNSVLGGGMSSRLFQEIREKRGLAYTAYSFAASYSDGGLFGMYAATAPEKAAEVIELARGELSKVADSGITEEERDRALGQIAGSSALSLEDSDTRMARLARAELGTGELLTLDASLERFEAVSLEDVRAVADLLATRPQQIVAVGDASRSALASS